MSDDTTTMQGSTIADGGEAQAQAQSAGETVQSEAQATTEQTAEAKETTQQQTASPDADEQDLGLLASAKPVEGAPEAYEAFTFPEGIEVEEGDVAALQAIAKEMNLPQQAAQAGAEMTARALSKMIANAKEQQEAWKAEQKAEWEKQPNLAEATLKAKKALDYAGMMAYAKENGYMHDATLMKMFAKFGELVSEGKVITGENAPPSKSTPYGPEWK